MSCMILKHLTIAQLLIFCNILSTAYFWLPYSVQLQFNVLHAPKNFGHQKTPFHQHNDFNCILLMVIFCPITVLHFLWSRNIWTPKSSLSSTQPFKVNGGRGKNTKSVWPIQVKTKHTVSFIFLCSSKKHVDCKQRNKFWKQR
jgi:hypothetical protein